MSNTQHIVASSLRQEIDKGRHFAGADAAEFPNQGFQKALEISGVLQTTLDLNQLLELFTREIQSVVPHDGLVYRNQDCDLELTFGTRRRHSCNYRVMIGEQTLGELVFTRAQPFNSEAPLLLEYLMCSLVYPLRNALLYRSAVQSANTDPLTGLYNRAALDSNLRREIDLAYRYGTPLSMIVMDIDHFKAINDRYGHAVGDNAIKAVSDCIARTVRSSDIAFRYGGEEFVVLLSNTGCNGVLLLAERIRREVGNLNLLCADTAFKVTLSAGVSTLDNTDSAATLFTRADKGLYIAKHEGRNRVRVGEA
jgi:diguanylate cyclase (GGDEF)-like protein